MQLAHASTDEPWPVVRTVGFQAVRPDAFTFLLKRRTGHSDAPLPVAISYVEGRYVAGEVCEQWRAEGLAYKLGREDTLGVLETAPPTSL